MGSVIFLVDNVSAQIKLRKKILQDTFYISGSKPVGRGPLVGCGQLATGPWTLAGT